jgi:hypothetical protein
LITFVEKYCFAVINARLSFFTLRAAATNAIRHDVLWGESIAERNSSGDLSVFSAHNHRLEGPRIVGAGAEKNNPDVMPETVKDL